jgi:glutathione synthase/RimK-type ligase-like ATP-grasp enzyme
MILIIGSNEEVHAKYVFCMLKQKGYEAEFFDTRQYPHNLFINFQPNTNEGSFIINGNKIYFNDIQGIYWRWFYGIFPGKTDDSHINNIIFRERNSAISSIFQSLKCNWVNSYKAIEMHKSKTYQLNLLAQNNIRIPKTLVTNDKEELIKFYEQNNKNLIYKPVLGGALTERLKDSDVNDERLDSLATSPIQLQEFIDGTDIRVFAMGDKVFAAEIRANTIDFRGDNSAQIIPCELPDNIINDCKKVLDILSLTYSGIDIKRNNAGEYIFIEANPAPMFLHFEKQTKFPITDTLIELLTK